MRHFIRELPFPSLRTGSSAVAAAYQNAGNNEYPDAVVIIEKIAKTVHKYPPFAAKAATSGKFCLPVI